MVNPQLLQYVRAQRAAGISKEEIIKALAGGGWTLQDAQEAFAAIDAPPPPAMPRPAPPPPVHAPVTSTMAAPQPAMVQPRPAPVVVTTHQPISVRPQPSAVVQPRSVYAPQPKRASRWPWVLLGLIIFFIFGVAAGAYLAVTNERVDTFVRGALGLEIVDDDAVNLDQGGFLEVADEPFDIIPPQEENSTSTPVTSTSTSMTATTTATSSTVQ